MHSADQIQPAKETTDRKFERADFRSEFLRYPCFLLDRQIRRHIFNMTRRPKATP